MDAYVAMRCDPRMMAELGGPLPRDGIEAKVAADVATVRSGEGWILMILPDPADPDAVAGSVVLWSHPEDHEAAPAGGPAAAQDPEVMVTEIGWMVLPEFQGRGLAKRAVSQLLDRAAADGRWGTVHAFPGVTNVASNAVCRSLGFTLVGTSTVDYRGRPYTAHHWQVEPGAHRPQP